jgi:hypothetical protein
VLRLPIDLSCVSDALLGQLAALLEAEDIEMLRDRKDKITSRLYVKKLEALLADDTSTLHRCAFCARLFTAAQREWEPCPRAPPLLDFHGNPIAEHVPNRAWDVHRWVSSLRRSKWGAREAFWRLWGLTHFVTCSTCDQPFPVSELDRCSYHPHEPVFDRGEHRGHYPCCGQPALRFDACSARRRGCLFRRHTPVVRPPAGCASAAMEAAAREASKVIDIALAHADLVIDRSGGDAATSDAGSSASSSTNAAAADGLDDELLGRGGSAAQGGGGGGGSKRPASAVRRVQSAGRRAAAAARAGTTKAQADDADPDAGATGVGGGGSARAVGRAGGAATATSARSDSDASYSDSDSTSAGSLSDSDSDPDAHPRASATKGGSPDRGRAGFPGPVRRSWQLESLMMEDEAAMGAMGAALERLRREPPPPNQPGALMGAKPFFLDRRQISHLSRPGGSGVLWPKTPAAAARTRH